MNFFLLAASLCTFSFAVAWLAGLLLSRRLHGRADGESARAAFAAGIAPLALAVMAVLLLVIPAVMIYEPIDTRETAGTILLAGAAAGLFLLMRTTVRLARMILASHRLVLKWRQHAEPLSSITTMRALSVNARYPVVAVAGFARAALYIDRRVLQACSADEIEAIAAHELAHVHSRDNWKRLLLAATCGTQHRLFAAWRDAAEIDADRSAGSDPRRGLALASALLKVATVAAPPRLDDVAVSGVQDGGCVEARVRALLSVPPAPLQGHRRTGFLAPAILLLVPLAWKPVHVALELVVNYLP